MQRFVLLILLGLHFCSGESLCNKKNIDDIAAPKFDRVDNLSYDKCGRTTNGGNGKWYVAIGADGGRWCFGLLLSNKTIITANCRAEADDFVKDKPRYKAKFGGCYKKVLDPASSTPCNPQEEEVSIANVTSLKDFIKNTDIHLWKLAKSVALSFTPICLFNEGSKGVNTRYQVCDRKWADCKDVSYEGTISDLKMAEKNELCVNMKSPIKDSSLDFLVMKKGDRIFLRGFFYWHLDTEHVSYVDLLPFLRQIVNVSYGLFIMPEIPSKPAKIEISDITGVKDVMDVCGKSKDFRRRRRDLQDHFPVGNMFKGVDTRIEKYPWHVYLQINGGSTCGGSIISKNVILTAAHCVQDGERNKFKIVAKLGLSSQTENATFELKPRKVVVHHSYKEAGNGHDAALLFFNETFSFSDKVQPVCLWDGDDDDAVNTGNYGYIVGWGVTENKENIDTLQNARVPLVKYEDCYYKYMDFYSPFLKPRQNLCVGGDGTNACMGDSGGGFVMKKGKKWYIRGLSSFGPGKKGVDVTPMENCKGKYPSLFESVVGILYWIKVEMAENAS